MLNILGQNGQLRYEKVDQAEIDKKRYEEAKKNKEDSDLIAALYEIVRGNKEAEKKRLAPPKDRSKGKKTSGR